MLPFKLQADASDELFPLWAGPGIEFYLLPLLVLVPAIVDNHITLHYALLLATAPLLFFCITREPSLHYYLSLTV